MSEFDKRLKAAAERYEEKVSGDTAPGCSAELDRRVEEILARHGETGRERIGMKTNENRKSRTRLL